MVPPHKSLFFPHSHIAMMHSHFQGECFLDGLGLSSILEHSFKYSQQNKLSRTKNDSSNHSRNHA
jgi:hypothetical protein